MKPSTLQTKLQSPAQLRKVVFGGYLNTVRLQSNIKKRVTMSKCVGLLLPVAALILMTGCAAVTINPPSTSFNFSPDISFKAPNAPKNLAFKAKDGKKAITQDNVTVEVQSIGNDIASKNYSVTIQGADGREYVYSIFPMVVALKIVNSTDHIVTLERTIVRLEDDNQNEYPMISSTSDSKQNLVRTISKAFDDSSAQVRESAISKFRDLVYNQYDGPYREMVKQINAARSSWGNSGIRTPDMGPGETFTPDGTDKFIDDQSPDAVYKRTIHQVESRVSNIQQQIIARKTAAIEKIGSEIPDSMKGIITSGVYQPINVLPGRAENVFVPFARRKDDEPIKAIHVGVYDLPTEVNQAGIPTKRANFKFELVAE
jgi:hypothetical protein